MRAVTRLIGVGYGLSGLGSLTLLFHAAPDLLFLTVVGGSAVLHGLTAYAFLMLKPWARWPATVVNLLYLPWIGLFSAFKPTVMALVLAAVPVAVIWWSWQPGFPAGGVGFREATWPRAVLGKALVAALVILLVLAGFELQRHLRRCAREFVLDGREGCLTPLVFSEDTEYAPGYSAAAFEQLRPGMSEHEVLALVGPPLEKYSIPQSGDVWQWTRSPGSNSYRERVVVFTNGRVSATRHEFYID